MTPVGGAASSLREQVRSLLAAHPDGVLPIVQAGHPVLRQRATGGLAELGDLADPLVVAMRRTMQAAPGVGLAAPQVGLPLALAVIEDLGSPLGESDLRERPPVPFRVLVNPSYEPVGEARVSFFEGCLSVHGWQAVRSRWRSVRLTACDESGRRIDEVVTGWPARIVQHETDHLNGELYLDQAQMRSLSSAEHMAQWGDPVQLAQAATRLGFSTE